MLKRFIEDKEWTFSGHVHGKNSQHNLSDRPLSATELRKRHIPGRRFNN